jgi:hypothetical protein
MNRRIFQRDGVPRTHYSSIPSFQHSNCERSELSSEPVPIAKTEEAASDIT